MACALAREGSLSAERDVSCALVCRRGSAHSRTQLRQGTRPPPPRRTQATRSSRSRSPTHHRCRAAPSTPCFKWLVAVAVRDEHRGAAFGSDTSPHGRARRARLLGREGATRVRVLGGARDGVAEGLGEARAGTGLVEVAGHLAEEEGRRRGERVFGGCGAGHRASWRLVSSALCSIERTSERAGCQPGAATGEPMRRWPTR